MESNPIEKSSKKAALLKWTQIFQTHNNLESLDSIIKNPVLVGILSRIDDKFKNIDPSSLTPLQTCIHLSRFMAEKLNFRGILTSHCDSVQSMISQLLYVCVHCDGKEGFITDILKLQPDTQSVLMKIISETTADFQKYKQLKEVLDKVEELQIQNDRLRKNLFQNEKEFDKFEDRIGQLKKQMDIVVAENETYRKQKSQVLKQLNISDFGDYLELYKRLNTQYEELDISFKVLNERYEKQGLQNQEFKKKIIQDNQFIYFLSNESQEARAKWLTLKSIYSNRPSDDIYSFDLDPSPILKAKSTNIISTANNQNYPPKRQQKVEKLEKLDQFTQSISKTKIQTLKLFQQSQKLQGKCQKYKQIIKQLRLQNHKLDNDKTFLAKKINELQIIYAAIRTKY